MSILDFCPSRPLLSPFMEAVTSPRSDAKYDIRPLP